MARRYGIGYIVLHDDVITRQPVRWGDGADGISRIWREGDMSLYRVAAVASLAGPFGFTPHWYGYVLTGSPGTARIGIPDLGGWYAAGATLVSAGGWSIVTKQNYGPVTVWYIPTLVETGVVGLYLLALVLFLLFYIIHWAGSGDDGKTSALIGQLPSAMGNNWEGNGIAP